MIEEASTNGHEQTPGVSLSKVFICYSHKDVAWKDRLLEQLRVLEVAGELTVWDDQRISSGVEWLPEIDRAMSSARVAVLLVSADFLTSDFIKNTEIPRLLERRLAEGLRVIPVFIRPCAWQAIDWLAGLQGRPRNGKALAELRRHQFENELADLTLEIRELISPDPLNQSNGEGNRYDKVGDIAASLAPKEIREHISFDRTQSREGRLSVKDSHNRHKVLLRRALIFLGLVVALSGSFFGARMYFSEHGGGRAKLLPTNLSNSPAQTPQQLGQPLVRTDTPASTPKLPDKTDLVSPELTPKQPLKPAVRPPSQEVRPAIATRRVICSELEHCEGRIIACQHVGDDGDHHTLLNYKVDGKWEVTYGSWTNGECGTEGRGWHQRAGTCSKGRGDGFKRCGSVLVEQKVAPPA